MADGLARATGEVGVVVLGDLWAWGDERHHWHCDSLYGLYSVGDPPGQVATSSLIGYDAFRECDMVGISVRW